jgi:Zn-dependent protease with chaperone function
MMAARGLTGALAALLLVGCAAPSAGPTTSAPPSGPTASRPTSTQGTRPVDPRDAERLRRVMTPLIQAMNNPKALSNIKVGIMDDPRINAANAGNGEFFVTRGLLEKANDPQLLGVLAHEVAHEDLRHVAKAQTLGAGLNIGMVILDQIIPGSGALTPIAGQLIARGYSRREEYEADRHGSELLKRIGSSKQVMIDTLQWLLATEGGSSGGFFATHPATAERIEALKSSP